LTGEYHPNLSTHPSSFEFSNSLTMNLLVAIRHLSDRVPNPAVPSFSNWHVNYMYGCQW